MTSFNKVQSPTLESLKRALEISPEKIQLVGSTNPSFLAWVLIHGSSDQPRLVITHSTKIARQLISDIQTLDPAREPYLLEPFDESPYSGLYPNKSVMQGRTQFLWHAQNPKPQDIFVSSIEGLLQKTLPLPLFQQFELKVQKSEEIDLDLFTKQLVQCGYESSPMVEDGGTFSRRGDIIDIFSPTLDKPIRIEFFGDQIESIRIFDPETQRSEKDLDAVTIIPAREILFTDEVLAHGRTEIKKFCDENKVSKEARDILLEPLKQRVYSHGIDYWLPYFYEKPHSPLEAFKKKPLLFWLDDFEIIRAADGLNTNYSEKFRSQLASKQPAPDPKLLYESFDRLKTQSSQYSVEITKIHVENTETKVERVLNFSGFDTSDLSTVVRAAREAKKDFILPAVEKIREWRKEKLKVFIFSASQTQAQRIKYLFESHGLLADLAESGSALWGIGPKHKRKI